MIQLHQLLIGYRKGREQRRLSTELDFSASAGDLVAIVGPNGVGKSTLLRTIVRQQEALNGSIEIQQTRWDKFSNKEFARICSFVPTGQPLVNLFTVYEAIAMARYPYTRWGGKLKKEDRQAVEEALQAVHLSGMRDRPLGELSDGERQRTLIARALAQDTPLVLLDEPTAFLDIPNRFEVLQMMRNISEKKHKLFVFSSHDLEFILEIADKIWLLYPDNTREGAPEELLRDRALDPLFRNTDIEYDLQKGFYIPLRQRYQTVVRISGDPAETPWLMKALRRSGYPVSSSGGDIHVKVYKNRYVLKIKNYPQKEFYSIYSLILYLKNSQSDTGNK